MDILSSQLHPNGKFHIFNRGLKGRAVFYQEKNFEYFLNVYERYVGPFVDTLAYCLIRNHYHFLIQVKSEEELDEVINKNEDQPYYWHVSNGFGSFLQAYSRAMNKMYKRKGPIFESPFKRILVADDSYYSNLIAYIHKNPETHGIVMDFRKYKHSSYQQHLQNDSELLSTAEIMDWFGNSEAYIAFHENGHDGKLSSDLKLE